MDNQNCCCEPGSVRKELVRIIIERVQGERMKGTRVIPEPERKSPKAIFEVEDMLNNPYMNRDEVPLAMDIFKPVVPNDQELPVIVIIHGGGLVLGDRTMSRQYGRALASRGYLVFSVEYRLAPRANACEQLDDVCAGMDLVGRRLVDFNVDFTRVFLTAESAGAYLAIYVAAMKQSKKLQEAIGYEPTRMTFKALGLHCGMFYTDKCDPIGWLLADQFYGDRMADENFKQYLDPEHDEILKNLPPVFFTTSRGDFLNRYTLMYHEALKKAGRRSHLMYFGDNDLGHAFASVMPNCAASIDAIDKMVDWFEEQAVQYKADQKRIRAEKKALDRINKRIESGEIIEQKSWKFIKELNSYSRDSLDSAALADGRREYTYRQLFRKWERYAEVFSALDITGKNHSRAMIKGTPSSEIISALYALNMTGASVSLVHDPENNMSVLKEMIDRENITDIILSDTGLRLRQLIRISEEREKLGIRNIIVVHVPLMGETEEPWKERESIRRFKEMKAVRDVLFMDDLLKEFEATPICYSDDCADDAFIIHTSGTTTGKRKTVPVSDRGLNEASRRMLVDPGFSKLRGKASSCLFMDLSIAYTLFDMLHLPFAFSGKVTAFADLDYKTNMLAAILSSKPSILFAMPPSLDAMSKLPFRPDLSFLEFVFIGGGYVSPDAKKRFDKYLRRCGAKATTTIGYGNSESGAAVILSTSDREDDSIGYPLPGVKIRLYDEDTKRYLDPADGPCRGVLHICSPSVSCGKIDGRVLFEQTEIDGEMYLNTFDMVEVREDGAYFFVGRMNKFFVNNEGLRFNAGLVERALTATAEIEACGIVPRFSRTLRDTVPSLYVQMAGDTREPKAALRKALREVYIKQDLIKDSHLPFDVNVVDEIPYNDGGKVDIYKITTEKVKGQKFCVIPVSEDGVLKDIRIELFDRRESDRKAMPDELKKHYIR